MSVLLADDHEEFLRVVARHLEPHFDVIRTVGNGQAMLDEAARLEPDVVVLDISMPGLNGIEAAKKLKARGSRAKIVFLTVHADQDYVRAALGAGAAGYVLKSELASDLLPCLRQAEVASPFVSAAISWESQVEAERTLRDRLPVVEHIDAEGSPINESIATARAHFRSVLSLFQVPNWQFCQQSGRSSRPSLPGSKFFAASPEADMGSIGRITWRLGQCIAAGIATRAIAVVALDVPAADVRVAARRTVWFGDVREGTT